jgi:hypothetical protein
MEQQPIVVELELVQEGGCLSGRITGPDGIATAFAGWLGLTARLDALLHEDSGLEPTHGDAANRTREGDAQ